MTSLSKQKQFAYNRLKPLLIFQQGFFVPCSTLVFIESLFELYMICDRINRGLLRKILNVLIFKVKIKNNFAQYPDVKIFCFL